MSKENFYIPKENPDKLDNEPSNEVNQVAQRVDLVDEIIKAWNENSL
ncbi:hypothetical protein [Neobacillus terrae]|nr:hypothetical protein [Neobacillus terrae]NHM31963.1 hypothetical protein [Neobacillus terrae]